MAMWMRRDVAVQSTMALLCGLTIGLSIGNMSGVLTSGGFKAVAGVEADGDANVVTALLGATMQGAALPGAIVGGSLSDRKGRLWAIRFAVCMFLSGSLISSVLATGEYTAAGEVIWRPMLSVAIGRFLTGLGVGAGCQAVPIYVAEISSAEWRGVTGTSFQLAVSTGIFFSYLINARAIEAYSSGWNFSLGVPIPTAIAMGVASKLFPESPRWLVQHAFVDEARKSLMFMRSETSRSDVEAELDGICQALNASEQDEQTGASRTKLSDLLHVSNHDIWSAWLGIMVLCFQVLTGIDVIVTYGPAVFEEAGFESPLGAQLLVGATLSLSTLASVFVVDVWGRRFLLLLGSIGQCASMVCLAVANIVISGDPAGASGAKYIALACALSYCAFFSISWGPVAWILPSEIVPLRWRAFAVSLGTAGNWGFDALVIFTWPVLRDLLTPAGGFFFYAILCALITLLVYHYIPETKGRALESASSRRSGAYQPIAQISEDT